MGKIRETFRLVADDYAPTPTPVLTPTEKSFAGGGTEEMPFIEIGPRREINGSPDVLACPISPKKLAATPADPGPDAPVMTSEGKGVAFRTLPVSPRLPEKRRLWFAPELIAFHSPNAPTSRQYADLLATIVEAARAPGDVRNLYLFTGVRPQVGTTTVLLNLAITAARKETRVIVVDANLRSPAIAERVGLEPHPGLTEILNGDATTQEALRATAQPNLHILATGAPAALWADSSSLRELFHELCGLADLVFIDAPAWDGRGAASGLASISEVVFLVVPSREADSPPATELVTKLPAKGVPLAGCILTEV